MPALLKLEEVTKVFVTEVVETHALEKISFEIEAGEFVCVEGPSGSGKSTLLAILGLLDTPTAGQYYFRDKPTGGLSLTQRARLRNREIGFIFQSFHLIDDLTVYENVELPLVYRGLPQKERHRKVTEVLERVGMTHRIHHFPFLLSGGEQQRVAVARAIVTSPALLLADEPTGNLDRGNGETVMQLIDELHREGTTVVMVSHDPHWASYAHRRLLLEDGRLVRDTAARRFTH